VSFVSSLCWIVSWHCTFKCRRWRTRCSRTSRRRSCPWTLALQGISLGQKLRLARMRSAQDQLSQAVTLSQHTQIRYLRNRGKKLMVCHLTRLLAKSTCAWTSWWQYGGPTQSIQHLLLTTTLPKTSWPRPSYRSPPLPTGRSAGQGEGHSKRKREDGMMDRPTWTRCNSTKVARRSWHESEGDYYGRHKQHYDGAHGRGGSHRGGRRGRDRHHGGGRWIDEKRRESW